MKIAIIIPKSLNNPARDAASQFNETITIIEATMNEAITIAKDLENKGYNCIIARGGTYTLLLNTNIKIPIIPIPITNIDVFQAVNNAEALDESITIMAFNNMVSASESYVKISGKPIKIIEVKDENEVKSELKQLEKEGKKVVVGGGIINRFSSRYNITPIVIESGKESIVSSINDSIRIIQAIKSEKESAQRINAIIENTKDGIICIDNEGIINIVNKTTEKMLNIDYENLIGQKINKILPELEIKDTINSGTEEIDILKTIEGNKFIISKIPIKTNKDILDIIIIIKDIEEISSLEEKIRQDIAETGHSARYRFENIIGDSFKMKEIIRVGKEYANVNSTVLIEGETGTGKEVLAQSIHNYSKRSNRPFVAVNCAAIPENLLESELFGYAGGAFTGADKKGKRGLFEVAHTGTIFLDEISEMDPLLQGRLLRVLQEKEIMRIGSNKILPIDVRIIAATNKNLYKLVEELKFRNDLYYRLNVLKLFISPIRDRREDILDYLDYFIELYCRQLNKKKIELSNDLKEYLMKYQWAGNVREIRNFCERLCVMSKTQFINLKDIDEQIFHINLEEDLQEKHDKVNNIKEYTKEDRKQDGKELIEITSLELVEKKAIENSLIISNNNITKAAIELGISRTTMWRKMKKYQITSK